MKIVIVGNGVWGNALYSIVSHNTTDVAFSQKGQPITADVVVLALPTQAIRQVLPTIHFLSSEKIIVNTSKGIEKSTHFFPHEVVEEVLGNDILYASLMGPSFAEEVSAGLPTVVNLGTTSPLVIECILPLFQTSYFRVQPTKSMQALEVAGALKNVYAIGCGMSEGLGYKHNTRSQLLVMALSEIQALCKGLGVTIDPSAMPETVGDVILTCSSTNSRNYTFGTLLPQYPVEVCLERIGATVEGFQTAQSIQYLEHKIGISLPLAGYISEVIQENDHTKVKMSFQKLLAQ